MATTRTFQDMLNDYLPNKLLKEELVKRDYLFQQMEKDNDWSGGDLIVPFKGGQASTITFGSLAASNDIAETKNVRGSVTSQPEVWGSLIFNHKDLMQHGKVSEQNLLKMLPDMIEDFMDYFKEVSSINLLGGPHFATLTADASANDGLITVDHPERFHFDQKVLVDDDNSTPITGYVKGINMNTGVILLHTSRTSGVVFDFSAVGADMTTAQNAKCYHDGAQSNSFTSLKSALLSAANGGSATLYGQTKTSYPYLQAINIDGTAITAANIMSSIFDALTTVRNRGKGKPSDVAMSYKNFGSCLKVIEGSKGAYTVVPESRKASQYGWDEVEIGSVKGRLKLVGIQEMDDDVIYFIDWRAIKFYSNGLFQKRVSPEGKMYFESRATTGYSYIVDIALMGDLILERPSYCGVIHTVAY